MLNVACALWVEVRESGARPTTYLAMHVRRLTVRDIRAIRELDLRFDDGDCAGWHVMLGDNGTGKSTVVRALATVLMGAENAHASRQDWSTWVREGAPHGEVKVQLEQHPDVDAWVDRGRTASNAPVNASFTITPTADAVRAHGSAAMVGFPRTGNAKRTVWGTGGGLVLCLVRPLSTVHRR